MVEITYITFRYVISVKTDSETFHLIGFASHVNLARTLARRQMVREQEL